MSMLSIHQELISSFAERWTPERVLHALARAEAERIVTLAPHELKLLRSTLSDAPRYSLMRQTFAKAEGLDRQLKVAADLFPSVPLPTVKTVEGLREYAAALKATLQLKGTDFRKDRLKREERRVAGLPTGHRAYNKRFRFIARFEQHLDSRARVMELRELAQIAKSRLACKLDSALLLDFNTTMFAAYMTAKLNKRSIFTFDAQEQAYDEVADMLFQRLVATPTANWLAVAYVHPQPEVLARLTDEQKGALLGAWYSIMLSAARVLAAETAGGGIDLKTLVVRAGNDSSTWNEAAGAYNKARDGWLNTLYALGMEEVLEAFAPGKALRLMAADVVWGHQRYGEGLDPNTVVFASLPKPWDVLLRSESCTRAMIEEACTAARARVSGWLEPRKAGKPVPFTPTPELVHGVIISSPELAATLRRSGFFGGPSKTRQPVDLHAVDAVRHRLHSEP